MRKLWYTLAATFLIAYPFTTSSAQRRENERLENAGAVLEEILNVPDDIPSDLLDKAECVIVVPSVVKFAFGIGGSYGRGAMSCRSGENFTGPWSAPTLMAVEGGSFGLQLGGQSTDFILLVMNPRGANSLLRSKVKLGADAAAAAGPKGRNAQAATDVALRAEILTYSRSRGLFAGVSLEGSTLRPDDGANEDVYGRKVTATAIVREGAVQTPAAASKMISLLNSQSPNNTSDPVSLR
jgi:lipid-binding SYLF domain-containing protein